MAIPSVLSPEDDPEIAQTKKQVTGMDWELQLAGRRLLIILCSLVLCLYCLFTCSECLLLVMVFSACFCQLSPILMFPFMCSLVFYVGSHLPTVERIFTITEDIYELHEKYNK